jgi:O-antigen/teichoic acid export membrane protein
MIKKIFGGFFISNAAQAGLQFLMIPLIVRALGVEEYGKWGLFEPAIYLFALIAQMGGNWGILKLVNVDKVDVTAALRVCLELAIGPMLFAITLACVWGGLQFKFSYAILLMPWVIVAEAILGLGLAAARAKLLALPYMLGIISKFGILAIFAFINITGNSVLVSTAVQWLAVYAAAVTFAAFLANYQIFKGNKTLPVDLEAKKVFKHSAIKYGVPMLISAIFATILNNADRFIVSSVLDKQTLGQYVIALKLAGVLNFLITPVALWWPTARFQHIEDPDRGQAFFARMAIKFTAAYSLAGALLCLASPWILPLLAPGVHIEASLLFPLIFGVVVRAIEPSLNIGLLQENKTHLLIYTTALGAFIQIVLGLFLVKFFMAQGVAWAFFIASLCSLGLIHYISQRIYKLKFPYLRLFFYSSIPFVFAWKVSL